MRPTQTSGELLRQGLLVRTCDGEQDVSLVRSNARLRLFVDIYAQKSLFW